ncbi:MAG: response regulator [Calditrichia bacterium]
MIAEDTIKNILVVDDEEMIIDLLGDYFTDLGYGVHLAASAEEAISKLNNGNEFHLILTDINLPGKSGLDLLKIVNETKDDLPVILLTGLKTLDTAISAVKSGASDYITKPFELGTVRKIVEKVLNKQNKSLKKEKVYENVQHLRVSFQFDTDELDASIMAKELAALLSKMHFSDPDTIKQYELVFIETLLNSIEHGNLELASSIKNNDVFQMLEYEELKEQRMKDPEYAKRKITVSMECNPDLFCFTVKDEGPGFDWKKYVDKTHKISELNVNSHGRGFVIIRHIIDEVHFNTEGNMITLIKNRQ